MRFSLHMSPNVPVVERIEIAPKWAERQSALDERIRDSVAAASADASTTTYERADFVNWFERDMAFDLAPENEWTERDAVLEAFKRAHKEPGKESFIERSAFMSALGTHLREKFARRAGGLVKRANRYNITSAKLKSKSLEGRFRTNKKVAKALREGMKDPNRSRMVVANDGVSSRYFTEFIQLSCAVDLLECKLFPDAKELSESFGAFNAWRTHLSGEFDANDESITLLSVGDGCTPRTAGLFAFRTRWHCIAVDPEMGKSKDSKTTYDIARLQHHRAKIEEMKISTKRVVVVCVHAHVPLATTLASISSDDGTAACIAMPCCNFYSSIDAPGDKLEYSDPGILSPHRTVRVWRRLPCGNSDNTMCQLA